MHARTRLTIPMLILIHAAAGLAAEPATLVVCAPGYPGTTEQAQPAMDDLAAGIASIAGWPAAELAAVYHEQENDGLARLSEADAALALVPLPFYLKHRETLGLTPILEIDQAGVDAEQWSLVAKKGAVGSPGDLAGWTVAGVPGYAPQFVRAVALGDWGPLPEGAEIRFTSRVLSYLRKAATGEPVAVLLDAGQTGALGALPFQDDLEVVARSGAVPGTLLCVVHGRFAPARAAAAADALRAMTGTEQGRELLAALRIAGVRAPDADRLSALERATASGRDPRR